MKMLTRHCSYCLKNLTVQNGVRLYAQRLLHQTSHNQTSTCWSHGLKYLSQMMVSKRKYGLQVNTLTPPWRILFFGTDEFALPHCVALNENRSHGGDLQVVQSLQVVVPKNSRSCPVGTYAEDCGLIHHEWPIPTSNGEFDLGVIASFGHLIPERIINMFPLGMLNVHPSLLPRWRGAAPIAHTILHGDKFTGITIMEIKPKRFDIGPVLLKKVIPVPSRCTTPSLTQILANEGAAMLLDSLKELNVLKNQSSLQEDRIACLAKKVTMDNSYVNWVEQTMRDIDCQYRALGDMFPLKTEWLGKTVKLFDMVSPSEVEDGGMLAAMMMNHADAPPGRPHYHRKSDTLCVRCQDGWVGFKNVVIKTPMSAKSFHNGYLSESRNSGQVFRSMENRLDFER